MKTHEEMVLWAMANPHHPRYPCAGRPAIQAEFGIGSHVARLIAVEANRRCRALQDAQRAESGDPAPAERSSYEEKGDEARLTTVSRTIRTLEDALAYADVDLDIWEVERYLVNSWEMGSKDATGHPQVTPLWQVKAWLTRRRSTSLEQALEMLLEQVPAKPARARKRPSRAGRRMVEVALYDLHFGLLAWGPEIGENYDVAIARAITADAIGQIAQRTRDLGVERYLFPIGNDLFHINDPTGLTPLHRNRLDVDSRLPRIIAEVGLAMHDAVDTLRSIAPVKLIWVPGNHDPQTSYWLMRELAAYYRHDDAVEVDTSPRPRKVEQYGVNLIWFLHGCDLATKNEKALPGLFASEAAHLWAPDQYREIHRGHTHKKQELWFTGVETYGGGVVRTIPSLVGTDAWHYQKGFVETSKTAQFFVWNREYGLESVHDVHVDRAFYR